jgi:hypothetical protein
VSSEQTLYQNVDNKEPERMVPKLADPLRLLNWKGGKAIVRGYVQSGGIEASDELSLSWASKCIEENFIGSSRLSFSRVLTFSAITGSTAVGYTSQCVKSVANKDIRSLYVMIFAMRKVQILADYLDFMFPAEVEPLKTIAKAKAGGSVSPTGMFSPLASTLYEPGMVANNVIVCNLYAKVVMSSFKGLYIPTSVRDAMSPQDKDIWKEILTDLTSRSALRLAATIRTVSEETANGGALVHAGPGRLLAYVIEAGVYQSDAYRDNLKAMWIEYKKKAQDAIEDKRAGNTQIDQIT